MFTALSRAATHHPKVIASLTLVLGIVAAIYGAGVAHVLAPGGFEVLDGEAQRVATTTQTRFGEGTPDLIALVQGIGDDADGVPEPARVQRLVDRLEVEPTVAAVTSPLGSSDRGSISHDGRTVLLAISLHGDARAKEQAYDRIAELLHDPDDAVEVEIGGPLAVTVVGQETAERDLVFAELVALPLVAGLLALFFGGRLATLLPLAVGALSIALATALLRGLAELSTTSVFALNIVTLLGLGLAIDYSLFIVQRFREELAFGTVAEAVTRTVASAGKTTLFSGVAVAVSLLALLVFPIALLRSIAIAGALIVTLTVLTALLVLPSLLAWLGRRIEWPRAPVDRHLTTGRGWARLAQWVMRRPGLVMVGTVLMLLGIGAPALRLDTALSDAHIFPASFEVRSVQQRLDEADGFALGGTVQYSIVLEGDHSAAPLERLGQLYDTHQALLAVSGVVRVDDLVSALGQETRERFVVAASGLADVVTSPRIAGLVVGDTALLRVVAEAPHDAPGRAAQVEALRAVLGGWPSAEIGGAPKVAQEVDAALLRGAAPAAIIVVVVTLVVLTLAFGAIVVACKAVVMNVLSLAASFGALVWIFQDGRFEGVLRYQSPGTIDPLVLLVMFAIVFGLSMDYELFLLSRIREDFGDSNDPRQSVARGLASTGRLITMAGLMLIVVLLGFGTAQILFVKQLGIGMAIAVAIDATIVRALLVPATMRMLGRWNWWTPRWFGSWWERTNIGVRELPPGRTPIVPL